MNKQTDGQEKHTWMCVSWAGRARTKHIAKTIKITARPAPVSARLGRRPDKNSIIWSQATSCISNLSKCGTGGRAAQIFLAPSDSYFTAWAGKSQQPFIFNLSWLISLHSPSVCLRPLFALHLADGWSTPCGQTSSCSPPSLPLYYSQLSLSSPLLFFMSNAPPSLSSSDSHLCPAVHLPRVSSEAKILTQRHDSWPSCIILYKCREADVQSRAVATGVKGGDTDSELEKAKTSQLDYIKIY